MTLRQRIENVPRWPSVATTADLPNVSGALTQSSSLEHGDTCYVTSRSGLYLCTDAALGAAAWTPVGGGYGLLPNAPTVAALYHFDNSTVDVSGNGRNLAVSGSPSYEIGPRDRRAILAGTDLQLRRRWRGSAAPPYSRGETAGAARTRS